MTFICLSWLHFLVFLSALSTRVLGPKKFEKYQKNEKDPRISLHFLIFVQCNIFILMSVFNSMDLIFLNSAVAHLCVAPSLSPSFSRISVYYIYFLFCKMVLLDIYISEKQIHILQGFFLYPWGPSGLFSRHSLRVTVPDDGHVFPGF